MTAESRKYLNDIESLVEDKFESSEVLAEGAWDTATAYLNDLRNEVAEFVFDPMSINYAIAPIAVGEYSPARPDKPDLDIEMPTTPVIVELEQVSIEPVGIPSLAAEAPLIGFPDTPTVYWPSDPGEAPVITSPDIPTKPPYDLPDVPTIDDVVIPPPPSDEIPAFDGEKPVDDIDLPSSIFIYEEITYQSALKTAVSQKLLGDVEDGGTGLGATIEDAIWERARARKELENERKYDEVESYFGSRGFSLPPGALSSALIEVIKENARANEQINYEVAIEQARLAQTNTHFAITSAIQYEANIMAYLGGVATRALDSAKYAQDAAINLFNASVAKYNQKLATYQVCAVVYESKIKASSLILEKYKTQLESARITVDIQRQYIDIYRAQVSAVEALMNLYRVEMESARIHAEIEKLKLDGFRAKVDAYTAKVEAIASRYNAYQAQIAGEVAKANVYTEQVRAFMGRMEGAKTESSINIAEATIQLESNRNLIEEYRSNIEKYNAITRALIGEVETKGKAYGYDVDAYGSDTKLASSKMDADIESYKANSAQSRIIMDQRITQARINLDEMTRLHNLQVEAIKSGANVSAQMAASALSSVAAGAQLNFRGAFDESKIKAEYTNIGV